MLVTTYGVPLRAGQQPPNEDEKKALEKLRPELAEVRKKLAELEKNKDADPKELAAVRRQVEGLQSRERVLTHAENHRLVLDGTAVTGAGLKEVKNLKMVTSINLSRTRVWRTSRISPN